MKNTFISKLLTLCAVTLISTNVQAQFSGGNGRGDNKAELVSCGAYQIPTSAGTYSFTANHTDGATLDYSAHYLSGNCLSMGTIVDAAGGNTLGSTTLTMTVANGAISNSTDRVFAPRYVQVAPTSDGTVDIQFYYSQADFDAYNSAIAMQRSFPTNSADTANNKANIKVMRASTNTTETASLTSVPATITWDNTSNLWKVSMTGVSAAGFYYLTSDYVTNLMVGTISHLCPTVLTNDQTSRATIDWPNVTGASTYNLRYRVVGSNTWNPMTNHFSSNATLGSLAFNTSYEVQIQVKVLNNIIGEFKSYTFTTPSALPLCMPPSTLSHNVISNKSATFSWNASTYGILYQIQYREKNTIYWGGTSTAGLSRTFSYLKGSTDYEYQVRTKCILNATSNTWSAFSSISKLTTLPNPPTVTCLPPTNIYATINNANSVTIHWDTASNADFYTVRMQKANDTVWGGTSSTLNTVSFNYLLQNTKYYYKVRTRCLTGTTFNQISDYTALDSFMTPFIKSSPSLIFNDINAGWTVYPNPTQDVINVQFISPEDADVVIKVSDMTGRLVKTVSASSIMGNNLIDVNVADMVSGMYTLQVIQKGKLKYVTKFNKQN